MTEGDNLATRRVLHEAFRWIGTPYRHQGSIRQVGCDCLGLVRGIWRSVYGVDAPKPGPYSADWAEQDGQDQLLSAARRHCSEKPLGSTPSPGDLLVFRWRVTMRSKHLGILAGNGRFIHAYQGHGVVCSALVPQWERRISGFFAFPELPKQTASKG